MISLLNSASSLAGGMAVVTGASSGIGRSIALALSHQGMQLCLIGRDPIRLAETVASAQQFSKVIDFQIDLAVDADLRPLLQHLEREAGGLDVLIHSAGEVHPGELERARIEDLDHQYAINVRAPYFVTKVLLPFLMKARGQIVFINSSVVLTTNRPGIGQYSATKSALKAIADSLRVEVNPKGIRVLTLYLGRTATPMQEALFRQEGRVYQPQLLLQPEDVASMVIHTLMLPSTAEVTDITMRPMQKSY